MPASQILVAEPPVKLRYRSMTFRTVRIYPQELPTCLYGDRGMRLTSYGCVVNAHRGLEVVQFELCRFPIRRKAFGHATLFLKYSSQQNVPGGQIRLALRKTEQSAGGVPAFQADAKVGNPPPERGGYGNLARWASQ